MLRAEKRRQQQAAPEIVLLLTHVKTDNERDILLEIGNGDEWSILNDFHPLLEPRAEQNPVVIVLGCGTAGGDIEMFRPPGRLLVFGAPAVVACLVTVLGRHIVPVAVHLVEALRAAAAEGDGAPLGEALRTARRRCIADGNAAVMALTTLGNADWQLRSAG